ncbi:hypothetical protein [Aequorivita flava]|jgi:hypothetical protein|uniref:hypothetical protein n=1 Tax=Aequorivita flava TaxID=3114371 RepID=UPI00359FE435
MSFKTLLAYQKGFALSMENLKSPKPFPKRKLIHLLTKFEEVHVLSVPILLKLTEKEDT